jgi:hypothetical protein
MKSSIANLKPNDSNRSNHQNVSNRALPSLHAPSSQKLPDILSKQNKILPAQNEFEEKVSEISQNVMETII